jgi:hypothetical protein
MYQKGLIKWGIKVDSSEDGDYKDIQGAYLPHRCDNWVIGDIERMKLLVEDLEGLIASGEKSDSAHVVIREFIHSDACWCKQGKPFPNPPFAPKEKP